MKISGIYQITNLYNNKKYIGQSRDIYKRWKSHTQAIFNDNCKTLLRKAFLKYGLNKQVSVQGIYNNFLFEILEECDEKKLNELELKWLINIKPDYNILFMPPNPNFHFEKIKKNQDIWIQYHNLEGVGAFPAHSIIDEEPDELAVNILHVISTRKRVAVNLKGDLIFLILGTYNKKIKKKNYFLWSATLVEEIEFYDDMELSYNLVGEQFLFTKPIILDDIDGFNFLKRKSGNFAYGLHKITDYPIAKFFLKCAKNETLKSDISYSNYIYEFLEKTLADN